MKIRIERPYSGSSTSPDKPDVEFIYKDLEDARGFRVVSFPCKLGRVYRIYHVEGLFTEWYRIYHFESDRRASAYRYARELSRGVVVEKEWEVG